MSSKGITLQDVKAAAVAKYKPDRMHTLADKLKAGTLTDEEAGALLLGAVEAGKMCEKLLEEIGMFPVHTDNKNRKIKREFAKSILSCFFMAQSELEEAAEAMKRDRAEEKKDDEI